MRPMLAATVEDLSVLRFPLLASPKLDGIRAVVKEGQLLTRKLKPVPNHTIYRALSHSGFEGLDGELIVGDPCDNDCYRRTMSGVMTHEGAPRVTFWVFDRWTDLRRFHARWLFLPNRTRVSPIVMIRRLHHVILENLEQLQEYEADQVALGYEGVMLRDPDGAYKHGRSTLREGGLLKLKRFQDSEAEIIDIVEEKRNDNPQRVSELGTAKRSSHRANKTPKGTVGALVVRDIYTGVEFRIGTGLDEQTADEFWRNPPVGQIVKYKFQPAGVKDKPRFPVFLGLRAPEDLV